MEEQSIKTIERCRTVEFHHNHLDPLNLFVAEPQLQQDALRQRAGLQKRRGAKRGDASALSRPRRPFTTIVHFAIGFRPLLAVSERLVESGPDTRIRS